MAYLFHTVTFFPASTLCKLLRIVVHEFQSVPAFLVACTQLCDPVPDGRSFPQSVSYIYFWLRILLFWGLQRHIITSTQPHATDVALYTALFLGTVLMNDFLLCMSMENKEKRKKTQLEIIFGRARDYFAVFQNLRAKFIWHKWLSYLANLTLQTAKVCFDWYHMAK